jgi:uncharacterized damage-inducible protein DinB
MSTLELLLDALDATRERLLVAIEPLEDEALTEKNIAGDWSIADILTNLTAWESELVTALSKLDQNKRPGKLLDAFANPDSFDRSVYEVSQGRELDQIFEDFQLVRLQLEDWLSGFSEGDLTKPRRYKWFDGRSLRHIIAQSTYLREEKFLSAIEAFSQAWLGKHDTATTDLIPLTTISPSSQVEPDTQDENENSKN